MTRRSGSRQSRPDTAADTADGGADQRSSRRVARGSSFKTAEVARRLRRLAGDHAGSRRSAAGPIKRLLRLWIRAVLFGQHPRGASGLPAGRAAGREGGRSSRPHRRVGPSGADSAEQGQLADAERRNPPGFRQLRDLADAEHLVTRRCRLPRPNSSPCAVTRLQRRPPPTWPSCRPAKGGGILEVGKALLVRAQVLGRSRSDHQTAQAADKRPVPGADCADAGPRPRRRPLWSGQRPRRGDRRSGGGVDRG